MTRKMSLEGKPEAKSTYKSRVRFEEPPEGANMAKELLGAFRRHSSRVLLVDAGQGREFTGAELYSKVVFSSCEHGIQEILLALGLVVAGGALYGSNIDDGYGEERVLCSLVTPDLFVCQSRNHKDVMRLKSEHSRPASGQQRLPVIWVDNPLKSLQGDQKRARELREIMERDQVVLLDQLLEEELVDEQLLWETANERIRPDEHVLTYMLTSGSTGRPKVVKSTHTELMYGLYSMISATERPPDELAPDENNNNLPESNGRQQQPDKSRLLLPMGPETVFSGDLPLDHGAGLNTMFLSITKGAKFVIMPSYKEDIFWQSVHEYRITSSIASTTFTYKLFARLKELIEAGEERNWDLSCFTYISCCGAKMAFTELVREIQQTYTELEVTQCYGATEMGFMALLPVSECRSHLKSVGYLFPGVVAKVVEQDSERSCGPEERGQLHVWSRSKFQEYVCHAADDPQQMFARCHDREGFYMTGDLVHFDRQERLYVHGRIKDTLFLMQDWKILPEELEEILNRHPLVESSCVVGVPDRDLPGCDSPRAFVKLTDWRLLTEDKLSALAAESEWELPRRVAEVALKERKEESELAHISQDIYNFAAARTAKPKHIKGGVRILDEFPRVGLLNKIDRKVLRNME